MRVRGDVVPRMHLTPCPECGLPAEVIDRDVWPSTDGPIVIGRVLCVRRHHFVMPMAQLPTYVSRSATTRTCV